MLNVSSSTERNGFVRYIKLNGNILFYFIQLKKYKNNNKIFIQYYNTIILIYQNLLLVLQQVYLQLEKRINILINVLKLLAKIKLQYQLIIQIILLDGVFKLFYSIYIRFHFIFFYFLQIVINKFIMLQMIRLIRLKEN